MTPEDRKEQIKAATNLEELIGRDTELTGRRDDLRGRCPLHNGDNPTSLSVNAEKQVFHCNSCGAEGDCFTYVMQKESLTFPQALEWLGDWTGIAKPDPADDSALTLSEYGGYTLLPIEVLKGFGLTDGPDGVLMPYRDEDGELLRNKVRNRLTAEGKRPKTWWEKNADHGGEKSYLYGRDRLGEIEDHVIIVEGESDCQVLWHSGFPALGAPGQGIFKAAWAAYVGDAKVAYVVREREGKLPETMGKAFAASGLPDLPELRVVTLAEGDVLDLWRTTLNGEQFGQRMQAALAKAELWEAPAEAAEEEEKKSVAVQIVELTNAAAAPLFMTAEKEFFARLPVKDHHEIVRLGDGTFRDWAEQRLYETTGKGAHKEGLTSARSILRGQIRQDGTTFALHNRVAWHEGALWYDLTDADWRAVRIGAGKWEIVDDAPILFRRYTHQQPQVAPDPSGDAHALLDFLNLSNDDHLLFLVYALSCLVPNIPHPIPVFCGAQGSAKTTAARVLRGLVDPSALGTLSFPKGSKEFVQQVSHNWLAIIDNVTSIPDWLSDALSRASTGEGDSKRMLYSDDEDILYAFRRCVGITSITSPVKRPDLFDRAILFSFERIDQEQRQDEETFWATYSAALPGIFGGALNALAKAVEVYPALTFDRLPRMADFAKWGAAIAEGLGHDQQEFMEAYDTDIAERHQQSVEANPFAAAVAALMADRNEWEGTAGELLNAAREAAEAEELDTTSEAWPANARWASQRLNEAKTDLAEVGVAVSSGKREGGSGKRILRIVRTQTVFEV